MRVATWNVNSIRVRLPRLLAWLERESPDVVCLQETKVIDQHFPSSEIEARGYSCLVYGQPAYNGVAILSRYPLRPLLRGFPEEGEDGESRLLGALIEGTAVLSVYVPNGKEVGNPAYEHKLAWLDRLRNLLEHTLSIADDVVVCGDFNVAPDDRDVHDPERWQGRLLCSDAERRALSRVMDLGLVDLIRLHHPGPGPFTWWDYRGGAFHRGWGLRIDHLFASPRLAGGCVAAEAHREERKGERPSDHVPVVADFSLP